MAAAKTKIEWRKFRSYSGPRIVGTDEIQPPTSEREFFHVDRAFWLTAKVETGAKFGSIVMYDGTACTAGPDQHVAVYPRELADEDYNAENDQGGLWKLLRRLETVRSSESYHKAVDGLWDALRKNNWYVAQDGVLRYALNDQIAFLNGRAFSVSDSAQVTEQKDVRDVEAGDAVFGAHIRQVLTPMGGSVPKEGAEWNQSSDWASMFHTLFSHPGGFHAQLEFGKEHLVERTKRRRVKMSDGKRRRVTELGYAKREITALQVAVDSDLKAPLWNDAVDLAMCVYQSNSVNAPAIANKALARAAAKVPGWPADPNLGSRFAKWLVRFLGNNSYGRWDDDLKTGRYQRTRTAARASGLWPARLFDGKNAIMPKDLPG